MRPSRAPVVVLVVLYACFVGVWAWSGTQLPDRVATHFDGSGSPNGWMSRPGSQTFVFLFGFVLPFFIVGLFFATRILPSAFVNIPNRQYWLASDRREETSKYLVHHSLWLACLMVGLITGIEYSIVAANWQTPPHLSTSLFLEIMVPFLGGVAVWVSVLLRHFRKTPGPSSAAS